MILEHALLQLQAGRKAKRLHRLWSAIEAKLAEGVSHGEILTLLNANGLELTERTYKSYLYRYRKRHRTIAQHGDPTGSSTVGGVAHTAFTTTSIAVDTDQRPPRFEFDPRGLSPELLK